MKVTEKQLKQIIRESLIREDDGPPVGMVDSRPEFNPTRRDVFKHVQNAARELEMARNSWTKVDQSPKIYLAFEAAFKALAVLDPYFRWEFRG